MEGQPLITIYLNLILIQVISNIGKPEVTIQQNGDLILNVQAPVTMKFLRKHADSGVMELLKLMNR